LVLAGLDRKFLALDEQAALRNHLSVFMKPNAGDQRLATVNDPHRWVLSRVRCIAWFDLITITGVQSNCNAKASIHP
jgi:hypothetical protein